MDLTNYRTLGRSGLIVSPFALGTMTFGQSRWGSDEAASRQVFDAYVDAGGNFIDTANVYAGGESERLVGRFVKDAGLRDRLVLATKFGFNTDGGMPVGGGSAHRGLNMFAGGNGTKAIQQALEASLTRLGTDVIDLYWLHVWDMVTPVTEVLQTLGDLQRAGKIRYFGFSDMPAWYAAKAAALAQAHGVPGPIAMQVEYGLVERTVEQEHVPAALDAGLGVVPWGPLGAGLLSGKYRREDRDAATNKPTAGQDGANRLDGANPYGDMKFTARNWEILDEVRRVASELDRTPAQVALAWVVNRPGVSAPILGASRVEQLTANIAALDVRFSADQQRRLDTASAPTPAFVYPLFQPGGNGLLFGGRAVPTWR